MWELYLLIRAQKESFKSNMMLGFSSPLSVTCLLLQASVVYVILSCQDLYLESNDVYCML